MRYASRNPQIFMDPDFVQDPDRYPLQPDGADARLDIMLTTVSCNFASSLIRNSSCIFLGDYRKTKIPATRRCRGRADLARR
jgi:hypothetical protein